MEILFLAFLLDLILGDPYWLYHPVRAIGAYINFEERLIRRYFKEDGALRAAGVALALDTVLVTVLVVWGILWLGDRIHPILGYVLKVYFVYASISLKSLRYEGLQVVKALKSGLQAGRERLRYIVGRDTKDLSEQEVVKATVETIAENTTDGVIAPMLYALLFGPLGSMAFKAVSTLDSMVGYQNDKYIDLGRFSAKTDDVLNYIPARLTGPLMVVASFFLSLDLKRAWKILKRDHANHKSPNSAWSESAAAGALGIQLGGAHEYGGVLVEKPTIGDGTREAREEDIRSTIHLMFMSAVLFIALIGMIYLFL
ncbi:cobalamin biosynthesis protein CobD [Alkalibacter rhizosphaerae]|uniref:Cobalamin biosynthesis protein CobD n=2 Tax=Alkalibacter rhizosphaerae TaxID=2815577 RepID=A0A974XGZ0_9FIRM|nr:cobalamin biosynthesis protein CobD [Alkalibacter rhizosphaerae]